MKILITGSTGFLGNHISRFLFEQGHDLIFLARSADKAIRRFELPCEAFPWDAESTALPPTEAFKDVDAVIHLIGDSVATGRWTNEKKQRIFDSRVIGTRKLIKALSTLTEKRPKVLISASAVGIYGDRGEEQLTENSSIPNKRSDFLSYVCKNWENESLRHSLKDIRSVALRFGAVLSPDGGILKNLLPVFRLGLGGPIGSGKQWLNWIHIDDVARILLTALTDPAIEGPINVTAPTPITNETFSKAIGRALHVPTLLKVPSLAVKAMLGEKADLALISQKVIPERLMRIGFQFQFPTIDSAMTDLLSEEHLTEYQWVPFPVEEVFSFFSNERNLQEITPAWLNFKVLKKTDGKLRTGSLINYSLKLHGVPLHWQSKIDQWEENRLFSDIQVHGPYSKWEHIHRFIPLKDGTLIKDNIRYKLPGKAMRAAVAGSFVRHNLEDIFSFRKRKLQEALFTHR